jgi:hypothetical protein
MNNYWDEEKENGGSLFKATVQIFPLVTQKTLHKDFPVATEKNLYNLRITSIRSHIRSRDYLGINLMCYQL